MHWDLRLAEPRAHVGHPRSVFGKRHAAGRDEARDEITKGRRLRRAVSAADEVLEIPGGHHHVDRMPDEINRLVGRLDDRQGRIVRQMRLEQAHAADRRRGRARMGVNVDDVFALEVVNVRAVRKQPVEQQEAQIGDARFRKRRQAHETLHTHLPVPADRFDPKRLRSRGLRSRGKVRHRQSRTDETGAMEDENVGVSPIYQQSGSAFKASPRRRYAEIAWPLRSLHQGTSGNRGVRPSRSRSQASVTIPVTPSTKVSQG